MVHEGIVRDDGSGTAPRASERAKTMLESTETKTEESSQHDSSSSEGETEALVALTARAAEKVREIRAAAGIEEPMGLRLRVAGGLRGQRHQRLGLALG